MKKTFRTSALIFALIILLSAFSGCSGLESGNAPTLDLNYNTADAYDPAKEYVPGDRFIFGSYEQDNNVENGKEKIQWIVLSAERGRFLVVSEFGLDYMQYNTERSFDIEWADCDLRRWLNSDFLNEAFSDEELELVCSAPIINHGVFGYEKNTTDSVFCLGLDEAPGLFISTADLICQPTEYALSRNGNTTLNGSRNHWWLRDGNSSPNALYVKTDGTMDDHGISVDTKAVCVRPAIYISRSKAPSSQKKYRETDAEPFAPEKTYIVGDHFLLGAYEQDGNISNGTEAIEWQVIGEKDGKLLVLSRYGLDAVFFHPQLNIPDLCWSTSYLREWLNSVFLDNAFSDAEADFITLSKIENIGNDYYGTDGGEDTEDRLFLLSTEEVLECFPLDENIAIQGKLEGKNNYEIFVEQAKPRVCEPTEYTDAKCRAIGGDYDSRGPEWLLRTPGESNSFYETVIDIGDVNNRYTDWYATKETALLRPAFYIDCSTPRVS